MKITDNNLPLITVILNNYNNVRYLERSLRSVLNQTYPNLQILIIDDVSTEKKVQKIYQKFLKLDARIELHVNKKNSQIFTSRLNGIKYAKGEYITYLDGDDDYDFDFIRHLYQFLIKNKADIAECNFCYLVENTTFLDRKQKFYQTIYDVQQTDMLRRLFDGKAASFAGNLVWNKLYKAQVLKKAFNQIEQSNLSKQRIHLSDDYLINLFALKQTKKLVIDPYYYGVNYRRTASLELYDDLKKQECLSELNYAFNLTYSIFFQQPGKYDEKTFVLFQNYVINTFSQYLVLFNWTIQNLKVPSICEQLSVIDCDPSLFLERIKQANNTWLVPKVFHFKNQVSLYKKATLKSKMISFNLDNGLFLNPFNLKIASSYLLNQQLWDLFLFSYFMQKEITIFYHSESLLHRFQTFLYEYEINETDLHFKKIEQENFIQWNFDLDLNSYYCYNQQHLISNSFWHSYLNLDLKLLKQSEFLDRFFYLCAILSGDLYLWHNRSLFNFSYSFFFVLHFMFINLKKVDNKQQTLYLFNYLKQANDEVYLFNNCFYEQEQHTANLVFSEVKNYLYTYLTDCFNTPNLWRLTLLFFDELKFDYEANTLIPSLNYLLTPAEIRIFNALEGWKKNFYPSTRRFANMLKIENTGLGKFGYLFYDTDIFNNETYLALRKRPNLMRFCFAFLKRKISKN